MTNYLPCEASSYSTIDDGPCEYVSVGFIRYYTGDLLVIRPLCSYHLDEHWNVAIPVTAQDLTFRLKEEMNE